MAPTSRSIADQGPPVIGKRGGEAGGAASVHPARRKGGDLLAEAAGGARLLQERRRAQQPRAAAARQLVCARQYIRFRVADVERLNLEKCFLFEKADKANTMHSEYPCAARCSAPPPGHSPMRGKSHWTLCRRALRWQHGLVQLLLMQTLHSHAARPCTVSTE